MVTCHPSWHQRDILVRDILVHLREHSILLIKTWFFLIYKDAVSVIYIYGSMIKKSRCSEPRNWSLLSRKFLKVVSIKHQNVVATFTNQFFLHSFSYLQTDSSSANGCYWCHLILLPASLDACWWLARAVWKATNLDALHVESINSKFVYNSRGGEFFYTLVL